MGKLENIVQFTGSVGNLSAYYMRGVDHIVVRKKGGADSTRIKNSPEFAGTREQNVEFRGRAQGVRWMRSAIKPLWLVADHNVCGPLNKLMKSVQYFDTVSPKGERTIRFSKHASLLEGFSLNRHNPFDKVVRTTVNYSISRETFSAIAEIPELVPRANFFPAGRHPMFCIMAVLAAVPDLYPKREGKTFIYTSSHDYPKGTSEVTTQWLRSGQSVPATALEVKLESLPPADDHALVLSIGVLCGEPDHTGAIQPLKYAGCAKILAAG